MKYLYVFRAAMLSVFLLFSGFCVADSVDVNDVEITDVYANSAGTLLIKIDGLSEWLEIGQAGVAAADALYSTALAAKLAGKKITIRYWTQAEGLSTVGYIIIK